MGKNIWGENVLDSKDPNDENSVISRDAVSGNVLDEDKEIEKKEECLCKKEMDIDTIISMIYFLRNKQNYKTYKERFFDYDMEYIEAIRVDIKKKLSESRSEVSKFVNQMNATFKKYNINTCLRRIHFLAQSYLETASFRATFENRTSVPDNYMGGVDFQGRGMKQITHDYNYLAYFDYVNGTEWFRNIYENYRVRITVNNKKRYESVGEFIANNPKAAENNMNEVFYANLKTFAKKISEDLFSAFDSAGWYIAINTNTLSEMDKDNVLRVSRIINTGNPDSGTPNNLSERENYTNWLKEFFVYSNNCE